MLLDSRLIYNKFAAWKIAGIDDEFGVFFRDDTADMVAMGYAAKLFTPIADAWC